ncbi:MAG: exopolyphosphatase [Acidobacteria bacterium]|nr:exopolyphosphatase [Acidobacteriota bacterium]
MRLVTRSDFDGLACAVLLREAGLIDDVLFAHPKDVQDGQVAITGEDVLANLPFHADCGMWFDHHTSEHERLRLDDGFTYQGRSESAPSCARVIFDYFGGAEKFSRFERDGMLAAVDRCDSGRLTFEEILRPTGWILLSFLMDPRTGLGRYKDYRISNYQFMLQLIEHCRSLPVHEVLDLPDVQERVRRYSKQEWGYENMLRRHATTAGNVIRIHLLETTRLLTGNRFKEYVLFPEQNVSMRIMWGRRRRNVVFSVGHSVVNRSCRTDVGSLMLRYGGGGRPQVGTCQVPVADWPRVDAEILRILQENG